MFRNIHTGTSLLIVALTCFLLAFSPIGASAQRTMKGQHAIGIEVGASMLRLGDLGFGLNYSQYLLNAYWQVGTYASDNSIKTINALDMEYVDCYLQGDYMHRLLCTRSRSISLYGGGGAFIGYEFYDPRRALPANIDIQLPTGNFLYGVNPRIEAEIFIIKRLALTLGGCFPITFSSPLVRLRPQLKMGLRFDI